ncbi:MAG TPA: ATP-binding cassette domain-containing protein [Candidatus Nanoarchaeia archaeon]|nr:ATP-binding cassette domain-containing protein [Candidatus Nanoarchaeia archaeon]
MEPVICVKGLNKTFRSKAKAPGLAGALKGIFSFKTNEVLAVKDVSFSIAEGELVGFIGPNGAGKSTTIKMLTGILHPSSGEISVLGFHPQNERVKLAYKIGTIFGQRQQLWYHLPAIDSFNLFSKIYELDQTEYKQRLDELVGLFEIGPYLHTPVRKLSLGQRMRCEFVASLLHKPKVLFLDEPTIGLDIVAKRTMRELIRTLNKKEKVTIILTSHDLDDIEELCERVIIINDGRILFDGPMETIKKRLKYKMVRLLFEKPPEKIPVLKHVKILKREPSRIDLKVDRTKTSVRVVLDAYLKACKVSDLEVEEAPIEEVVEQFYKKTTK